MTTIDLHNEFKKPTYLSHLILQAELKDLSKITSAADYDVRKVDIQISLNGVEIRHELLEPILENWATRMMNQKMEQQEKKLKETDEWVVLMKDKEALDYEIDKRCKEKLQKMVDSLDVWE